MFDFGFDEDLFGSLGSIAGGLLGGAVGGAPGFAIGSGLGAFAGSGGNVAQGIGAGLGSFLGVSLFGSDTPLPAGDTFGGFVGADLGELGALGTTQVMAGGIGGMLGSILLGGLDEVETDEQDEQVSFTAEDRIDSSYGNVPPWDLARQPTDTSGIDFLNYGRGGEASFFN